MAFAVRATAYRSSSEIAWRFSTWVFGMQSRWPRVAGLMSMKAIVRSSSWTLVAGISPATILQNRQSGSAMAAAAYPGIDHLGLPADGAGPAAPAGGGRDAGATRPTVGVGG